MNRSSYLFEISNLKENEISIVNSSSSITNSYLFDRESLLSSPKQINHRTLSQICRSLSENQTSFDETPQTKIPVSTPQAPKKRRQTGTSKKFEEIPYKPRRLKLYSDQEEEDSFRYKGKENVIFESKKQSKDGNNKNKRRSARIAEKEGPTNSVKNRSDRSVRASNVQTEGTIREASFELSSQSFAQSVFDENDFWQRKLYWLMPRRDVGLWIQCCHAHCEKWRYVEEYHDPIDVPEIWYCSMNSDETKSSCDVAQQAVHPAVESDLIENAYNSGSIVWAKRCNLPWWPGIVDDSPETFQYFKLRKNYDKPYMYHVTFFDEGIPNRSWLYNRSIKPFIKHPYSKMVKKTKFNGTDYSEALKKAHRDASSAVQLTILQRLQKFSYVARYEASMNDSFSLDRHRSQTFAQTDSEIIYPSGSEETLLSIMDFHNKIVKERTFV